MKLRVLESIARNTVISAEAAVNRRLGREFIPADLGAFNIETCSVCNLKCRFCAYENKQSAKVSMPNEVFRDTVSQALEMGFTRFHLTPCTGDVFMDKHLFEKLEFFEAHEQVRGYHFFTNLTIPTREHLMRLGTLKKLERLTVSVYGHDEESFIAITKSTPKIYRRLMQNLTTLLEHKQSWPFGLSIGFRSTFDVPAQDAGELMALLSRFRAAGIGVHSSHGVYNNWGGAITQKDVSGLNIHIVSADNLRKSGACVKLFDAVQVMATGVVNACSCRDADATLKIGDVGKTPLKQIISKSNPEYMRIINEQQAGDFRPICKSCDYYRSIYHQPSNYRRDKVPTQSLAEFLDKLEG